MDTTNFITIHQNNTISSGMFFVLPVGGSFSSKSHALTNEFIVRSVLIDRNPFICGGKPIIRGTRISVSQIVELNQFLGWDTEKILNAYPHLTAEQIQAALQYYNAHTKEIDNYIKLEKEID